MMGLAAAADYAEAVTCEGSLDVTRYRRHSEGPRGWWACAAPGRHLTACIT